MDAEPSADPRREEPRFEPKDVPLRDDVRLLGALVGEMLREQGGPELFHRVEAARKTAIRRREAASPAARREAEEELSSVVGSLGPSRAAELVRSFAAYFRVVNLAERTHRIRRRRDYLRARGEGGSPQPGSLDDTVRRLRAAGIDGERLWQVFAGLLLEPVFTAHPTEATRRTLLEKEQRIARWLVDRLDPSRTPEEERAALARVRAEVTAAWQTEEHPGERPTVADEREHVLFYVSEILYRIVPPFYEELEETLERTGAEPPTPSGRLPALLRFASWVGGDMDGNPNVTAATIRETLARHRELVLARYREEVLELARQLSQTRSRVPVDAAVDERAARYAELFPQVAAAIPARHRDMPYRGLLRLVAARLEATWRNDPEGYPGAAGFAADLEAVGASLAAHRGEHAGLFAVRRLLRRVETFGFHLAALDVRQDARVHREVVGRLLGDGEWGDRPAAERAARLRRVLEGDGGPATEPDAEAAAVLEVFRAVGDCRERYGEVAVGPAIASMTRGADDLLSILVLARWAGLGEPGRPVPLDVVPLFETVPDLEAAPRVLEGLLADPLYRSHLAFRGDRQMVMIGYSDSNKDGGLAASRWALQRAQAALVEVAAAAPEPVSLTFFHGRGGSISRGGSKTHRAVAAAPRGAVGGRLRLTEQGEAIDASYGLRAIAFRTLERALGAVALTTAVPPPPDPREPAWAEMMSVVARESRRAYRELVYEDPAFFGYFRSATPIDVIERLPIGSRPASRRSGRGIEDLRAIPWVFAWTQSRHLLPGWYGLGSGLGAAVEGWGEEAVAEMIAAWPFAAVLLDDAEMVLAKADLPIAARYAELAGEAGRSVFAAIAAEHERTVELVLRLQGHGALLEGDPVLRRSIRLRNPYVDPMSFLQVDLLRRWRAAGCQDAELFSALLATVNGIAQGLQNTG